MKENEQNSVDRVLNGSAQRVLLKHYQSHPIQKYKDLVLLRFLIENFSLSDPVRELVREQIGGLKLSMKKSLDDLDEDMHRLLMSYDRTKAEDLFLDSKVIARIIRDSPKALRNKKANLQNVVVLLTLGSIFTAMWGAVDIEAAAQRVHEQVRLHKKKMVEFVSGIAPYIGEDTNNAAVCCAVSAIVVGLIGLDPAAADEMFDEITVVPQNIDAFATLYEKEKKRDSDTLLPLLESVLSATEAKKMKEKMKPEFKGASVFESSTKRTIDRSLLDEETSDQLVRSLMALLDLLSSDGEEEWFTLEDLYDQMSSEEYMGLDPDELLHVLVALKENFLRQMAAVCRPYEGKIDGEVFIGYLLTRAGNFDLEKEVFQYRFERLTQSCTAPFAKGFSLISDLPGLQFEQSETGRKQLEIYRGCWLAELGLDLLYESRSDRRINEAFYNHILDFPSDPPFAEEKIDICIRTAKTSLELVFLQRFSSLLRQSDADVSLRKSLLKYLRSDILHSSGAMKILVGKATDIEAFDQDDFFHIQAAVFLLCLLEDRKLDALCSPYSVYLDKMARLFWYPGSCLISEEKDDHFGAWESDPEDSRRLFFVSGDRKPEDESAFHQMVAIETSLQLGDLSNMLSIGADVHALEDSRVYDFLCYINEDAQLKSAFSNTSWAMRMFIVHLLRELGEMKRRICESERVILLDPDPVPSQESRISKLEAETKELRTKNRSLKKELRQAEEAGYARGVKETEDRLMEEIRQLKAELKKEQERAVLDEDLKKELYQLRELLLVQEDENPARPEAGSGSLSAEDVQTIDTFLHTHKVVFVGGHYTQCAQLKEKYPDFRVYFDEQFPAEVVSSADLVIVFYKWISHGTYYKAKRASRTQNRTVPIEYISSKNVVASERELLEIIRKFDQEKAGK